MSTPLIEAPDDRGVRLVQDAVPDGGEEVDLLVVVFDVAFENCPEEQDANDTMMICVSRAACAKLVLDL